MIYVTGDTHGGMDISKLNVRNFLEQKQMTKDDFVIVCGDFGLPWGGDHAKADEYWLKWLEDKPFTTLFVDGNHENFNLLEQYPMEEWNGGMIHRLNNSVFHLCRGYVFELQGKKFFTFGGAKSQDKAFRKTDVSWWAREEPNREEFERGFDNLIKNEWKVDYIISHAAPQYLSPYEDAEAVCKYFDRVVALVSFQHWYFGHYHLDVTFHRETPWWRAKMRHGEFSCVYQDVLRIV